MLNAKARARISIFVIFNFLILLSISFYIQVFSQIHSFLQIYMIVVCESAALRSQHS